MKKESKEHIPVLADEVVRFIQPRPAGVYVDATLGAGGHAERILEESSPDGRLIGIDIDPEMILVARKKLAGFSGRCVFVKSNFTDLKEVLEENHIDEIDGIVFDLGVSSLHFTDPKRGFSFTEKGPLDMRLCPEIKLTAGEIINYWSAEDIANVLYKYSEERKARRIAGFIVRERKRKKIDNTITLAELVMRAVGKKGRERIHPATRTFQALRIAVNNELGNIEKVLPAAIGSLKKGGKICVISFHSLEDRIVKNTFRLFSGLCVCPPDVNVCTCGAKQEIRIITKKPVTASEEEILNNPCSRSAKLRAAEKI